MTAGLWRKTTHCKTFPSQFLGNCQSYIHISGKISNLAIGKNFLIRISLKIIVLLLNYLLRRDSALDISSGKFAILPEWKI